MEIEVGGVKQVLGLRLIPLEGQPPVEAVVVNGESLGRRSELVIKRDGMTGWTRNEGSAVRVLIRR